MQIHHVGYLVKNIRKAIAAFTELGFQLERDGKNQEIIYDEFRKIQIAFMANGPYKIELVEPIGEESPIYGLLKKYKNTPYHICYITENIQNTIKQLEKEDWFLFQPPKEAPAINSCLVAFMMNPVMGMIELVEQK